MPEGIQQQFVVRPLKDSSTSEGIPTRGGNQDLTISGSSIEPGGSDFQLTVRVEPPVLRVTDSAVVMVELHPEVSASDWKARWQAGFSAELSAEFLKKRKSPTQNTNENRIGYVAELIAPKDAIAVDPDQPIRREVTETDTYPVLTWSWALSPKKVGNQALQIRGLPKDYVHGEIESSLHEKSSSGDFLLPKISYQMPKQSYRVIGENIILFNLQVLDEYGLTATQHAIVEAIVSMGTLVIPAIIIGTLTGLFTGFGDTIRKGHTKATEPSREVMAKSDSRRVILTDADSKTEENS